MSRPQPSRPGAPARPGATTPQRQGPTVEEVNAMPEFEEDAANVDLDPSLAHDGGLGAGDGTTVTIVGARFGKFQYPGRADIEPELRLFVNIKRAEYPEPREESFRYAEFSKFVASKDGNFAKLRPSAIKKNKDGSDYKPNLYKFNQGVLFLQSLKDAGFSITKLNKEGLSALAGLTVHVRKQKVAGQGPNARAALLVDSIGKQVAGANTGTSAPAAPAAQVAAPAASGASDTDKLAESALLDLLDGAEGKTMARAQIPTTLIRHDKWKAHESRGAILKTLRDDAFVNHNDRKDVLWTVDGANITKL